MKPKSERQEEEEVEGIVTNIKERKLFPFCPHGLLTNQHKSLLSMSNRLHTNVLPHIHISGAVHILLHTRTPPYLHDNRSIEPHFVSETDASNMFESEFLSSFLFLQLPVLLF